MSANQKSEQIAVSQCCSYFKAVAAGSGAAMTETPGVEYFVRHVSAIMGLSWTHAGDGLLVSGESGEIAMYEVPDAGGQILANPASQAAG